MLLRIWCFFINFGEWAKRTLLVSVICSEQQTGFFLPFWTKGQTGTNTEDTSSPNRARSLAREKKKQQQHLHSSLPRGTTGDFLHLCTSLLLALNTFHSRAHTHAQSLADTPASDRWRNGCSQDRDASARPPDLWLPQLPSLPHG